MRRVFGIGLFLSLVLVLSGCGATVPDFRGMTGGQAEKAIEAAGLTVGDVSYDVEAGAATGTVTAQKPDVGTRATKGLSIALTLAGPAPVTAANLAGLDATSAAAAIAAAGLKVGAVVETYSATVPAGTLISADPVPGIDTPPGSTIGITVSKGPAPVAVPKVTKKSEADARKVLVAAGFKVTVTKKMDKATAGTVITQSPSSGKAQPGTSVKITVSAGVPTAADLIGTWKSAAGAAYTFRVANRVAIPSGGVVRYRYTGNVLQVFSPVSPILGTIAWVSPDEFKLTVKGKTVTYKRA